MVSKMVHQKQQTRLLTESEIDFVVSVIPKNPAGANIVAEKNNEEIKKSIKRQLSTFKINVSKESLSRLREIILDQFHRSVVPPGEPVGYLISMAIGQPLTQMNLNQIHSSGKKIDSVGGIDVIRELFNVSKKRKKNLITVHFNDKNLTAEEAIDIGKCLSEVSIKTLLKGSKILNEVPEKDKWWYTNYINITGSDKKLFETNLPFLRLYLDITKCYFFEIFANTIVETLEIPQNRIKCIASPTNVGVIDIYSNEEYLSDSIKDYLEQGKRLRGCDTAKKARDPGVSEVMNFTEMKLLFLSVIVRPCLDQILIRGIRGIKNIIPQTIRISTLFRKIKDPEKVGKRVRMYTKLDSHVLKYNGIPKEKVVAFIKACGVKILTDAYPVMYLESEASDGENPIEVLSEKLTAADDSVKEEARKLVSKNILPDYPEVYRNGIYTYAVADSEPNTSIRRLMNSKLVDSKYVISNNSNEILRIFGIEAARLFMIQSYTKLISGGGSPITPYNISLLVDFQTSLGMLLPITAPGAAKQGNGALTNAAFQDPLGMFTRAAAAGKRETISTVSSSLITGKRTTLGTGAFEIIVDESKLGSRGKLIATHDQFEEVDVDETFFVNDEFKAEPDEKDNEDRQGIIQAVDVIEHDTPKKRLPLTDKPKIPKVLSLLDPPKFWKSIVPDQAIPDMPEIDDVFDL